MNICAPHIATILALTFSGPAAAGNFCVDTPGELHSAMDAAETNNADDEIRLVGGSYASTGAFSFQSTEARSITFIGGWSSNCVIRYGAETTIDGESVRRGLRVSNLNGNVTVRELKFVRGLSTNNRGGGLNVTSNGAIRIDSNMFIGNRADDLAGALRVSTTTATGTMAVRNNLAFANSASATGAFELFQISGEAFVVGNTIIANLSESSFSPGGLYVGGGANFVLSNNIIWNNLPESPNQFDADFNGAANSHSRYYNDIGVISSSTIADQVVGELSVDPQFAPCDGFLCFNFELERSSPLIDVAEILPPGGMTALDLAGKPRIIGSLVDIGAYENDLIFTNSFD